MKLSVVGFACALARKTKAEPAMMLLNNIVVVVDEIGVLLCVSYRGKI